MIKNCHSKLITTGSVTDSKITTGRPSTSSAEENIEIVREMITKSLTTKRITKQNPGPTTELDD